MIVSDLRTGFQLHRRQLRSESIAAICSPGGIGRSLPAPMLCHPGLRVRIGVRLSKSTAFLR
jgi:hypothetical protein